MTSKIKMALLVKDAVSLFLAGLITPVKLLRASFGKTSNQFVQNDQAKPKTSQAREQNCLELHFSIKCNAAFNQIEIATAVHMT